MRNILAVGAGVGVAMIGAGVLAHHSFSAEFDANKRATFTGTVTSVEWRNPHTWFYVDVPSEGIWPRTARISPMRTSSR